MTTSRTGTASHRKWREHALTEAKNNGQTHCPLCGTRLNYTTTRQPNSAEPDHITPYAHGGTNTPDNARIICRQCNQRRGAHTTRHHTDTLQPSTTTTLLAW